jgi:hypothetical protein
VRQQQLRNLGEAAAAAATAEAEAGAGASVAGVRFEQAYSIIQCDRECWHGGSCFTLGWPTEFAPDCICPEAGLDGPRCAATHCERACDHGGYCGRAAAEEEAEAAEEEGGGGGSCVRCAAGWSGAFCGTASSWIGTLVVWLAGFTIVVLLLAAVSVLAIAQSGGGRIMGRPPRGAEQTAATTAAAAAAAAGGGEAGGVESAPLSSPSVLGFAPLQAQGVSCLLGSYAGGCIWLLTTVVSLRGEAFRYDSVRKTLRKRLLGAIYMLRTIDLPGQARDKHRNKWREQRRLVLCRP